MKLTIELTYKCPLKCVHCSSVDISSELTLKDVKDVLQRYKIDEITLSGGEPFVHPHFRKICRYLLKRYPVSLNTCGLSHKKREFSVYDERMGRKIHQHMIDDLPYNILHNFKKIYVSIYGDELTHNSITCMESYINTWKFYLLCRWIMNTIHGRGHRKVIINTPIFSQEQIKNFINDNIEYKRGSMEKRLDYVIHFIRLLKHGRATNLDILSREEQLAIAMKIKAEFPENILISQSLLHEHCNWENKLTLLADRRVIHCVAGKWHSNPNQMYVCEKSEILRRSNVINY